MSRRMERLNTLAAARNVFLVALHAPAGHKYEILTIALIANTAAQPVFYGDVGSAASRPGILYEVSPATGAPVVFSFNAVLLDEGDELRLACLGAATGNWGYHVTYMDVAFNG